MNTLRSIARNKDVPNILVSPTHEGNEYNTAKTGFNYYAMQYEGSKPWQVKFRPVPSNYYIMNYLPPELDIDVVMSQTKFGQFQRLAPIAKQLQVPLISLEHTLPMDGWGYSIRQAVKSMRGDLNVFISEYSVKEWGFSLDDESVRVLRHGIDTEIFRPDDSKTKNNVIFSCVNDFVNRDYCCGWNIYKRVTDGLPARLMGDTKGVSLPSNSIEELVDAYQTSRVFLNTSTLSPVPTVMMEAMACGLPVVSTSNCMIPEVIEHGVSGFLTNDESEMKKYLKMLLADSDMAAEIGYNARERILKHFNQDDFVENWKTLIRSVL